jgi:rhodanese-related sulfurtransferase
MPDVNIVKFATTWPNYLYVLTAVASGTLLLMPALRRGAGGAGVSAQQATLMMNREDAVVLDVREPNEFQKGHILHARSVPLSGLEDAAAELQKLKSKPVIVACETGNRSGRAAATLRKLGFEKVHTLVGGLAAWQQAGLPVEK